MFRKCKLMLLLLAITLVLSSSLGNYAVYGASNDSSIASQQVSAEETPMPSEWATEEINWATIYNLVPENLLSDFQQNITREEICTLAMKLYEKVSEKEANPIEENPFTDTNNIDVLKAYNLNIIDGVSATAFAPTRNATREEIAVIFYNAIKASQPELQTIESQELFFSDKDQISSWAIDAVRYMTSKGILKGKTSDTIVPGDNSTREESIVLIKRIYELIVKESGEASKGIIWKVSDENSHVYVLGSVHLATNNIYPLSDNLTNAYEGSDYLAVEANILITNPDDVNYMNEKAVYQDGSTLKDHVSEDTYEKFNEVIVQFGFEKGQLDSLKPWYSALLLGNLSLVEADYEATLGVDYYFLAKAFQSKEIKEIEGLRFQIDLFDNFDPEFQEQYLLSTMAGMNEEEANEATEDTSEELQSHDGAEAMNYILETWKNGDIEEFEKYLAPSRESTDELSKEFNEKFWYERDKHMAETVAIYLADENNSTYFVVVGAGHLITDKGVINLLREKGYTIEQVK